MKNFVRSLTSSLLLIAMSGVYVPVAPSAAANTGKPAPPQAKREGFRPQVIKGEAVALHARALRARNKGVARAMKDLEKKGFRQAFDQSVSFVASKGQQAASAGSVRVRPAAFQSDSETFYNDGYEMTFISYDDGDPNTWEGVVYEHDPYMNEYSYTVSLDISGQPDTWAPIVETYYPADGSGPVSSNDPSYYDGTYQPYDPMYDRPVEPNMAQRKSPPGSAGDVRFTKASYSPAQQRQSRWRDRLYRWSKCVVGGCTVSAIGCIASGPAWLACFTAWCGGTEVGCVILSW